MRHSIGLNSYMIVEYIDDKTFESIHNEANEITSILASIVKTTKENSEKYDNTESNFLNS